MGRFLQGWGTRDLWLVGILGKSLRRATQSEAKDVNMHGIICIDELGI